MSDTNPGSQTFFANVIAFATLIIAASTTVAGAASCVPPVSFVDTPHPALSADAPLVAHTETITFDHPLSAVLTTINRPLKDTVHQSSSLPGVIGDFALRPGEFGAPGTRRLVCLSDGSTLEEQSLEREQTDTTYHFRYVVWNYTTPQAAPIEYGLGDFQYNVVGAGKTHLTWVYSFKLRDDHFPGYLGSLGRFLFRVDFLDRAYADMMRSTLAGMKSTADSETAVSSK